MASRARRSPRAILLAALVTASASTAWALAPPDQESPLKDTIIESAKGMTIIKQEPAKGGPPIAIVGRLSRAGIAVPGVDLLVSKEPFISFHGTCSFEAAKTRARPTAEDGSFELVVHGSGTYCIRAEAPDHNYPASVVTVPDDPTHRLEIVLPSVCLSGSVIDESTGEPVAQARVAAREQWPWPRLSRASATTSHDGHFHMDLEASEYSVSARLDKGGVAQEDVSVGEAGFAGLVLSLVPGLQIAGRVVDGAGRGLAGVEVGEDPPSPQRHGWTKTGPNGSFRIDGLTERQYVLTAQSETRYAVRGGILPGASKVVLRLRNRGYVNVLVRDPQGRPVEDAHLTVNSIDGAPAAVFITAMTDDEGLAEIGVPVGTVGLAVVAEVEPGWREVIGEAIVSVREGESVSTVLSLHKQPLPTQP